MDYDIPDCEDLIESLYKIETTLAKRGWYETAGTVSSAAARMRLMQDDIEDLAAQVAELSEQVRRLEMDRDVLRDDNYYLQDLYDEAMSASVETRDR